MRKLYFFPINSIYFIIILKTESFESYIIHKTKLNIYLHTKEIKKLKYFVIFGKLISIIIILITYLYKHSTHVTNFNTYSGLIMCIFCIHHFK